MLIPRALCRFVACAFSFRPIRLAVVASVFAVLAAACGGSSATESTSSDEEPAAEAAEASEVDEPTPATTTTPTTQAPATTVVDVVEQAPETTVAEPVGSDPVDVAAVASAGCGASAVAEGSTSEALGERAYLRFIPSAHDGVTPVPLVLNFHGLTSNAGQQVFLTGLDAKAGQEGFVAVHPEGSMIPGTETTFFNTDISGESDAIDDVAFVDALLDELETTLCVDTNRIFTTGMSNGGFMSSALACTLSDRFAAAASVAGISYPEGSCSPTRPVPMLHVHGTGDVVVPFDGGASSLSEEGGTLEDAEVNFVPIPGEVDQWAEELGCDSDPEVIEFSDEVTVEDFGSCDADLEFWIVDGGGHTWPGTSAALALQAQLGFSTDDFNTTDLVWDWFVAHPKQ